MRRLLLLALLLTLGAAACGGGGATISQASLGDRILRARDVGAGFTVFYNGRETQLDTQGTPRANPARFGRKGGWIARYKRSGKRGPLLVESRLDVFGGSGGARKDLGLYRQIYAATAGASHRSLALLRIGDEAVGDTFLQPGAQPLRFLRVAWRYRNATAQVVAEGFDGRISQADVVRIARKQQQRLVSGS